MGEPGEPTPAEMERHRRIAVWTRRSAFLILIAGVAAAAWPFSEGSHLIGVVVAGLFGFSARNAWVRGTQLEQFWASRLERTATDPRP